MPVETPEHNKRKALQEEIDRIALFLEWIDSNTGLCVCEYSQGVWRPSQATADQIAERYFRIDTDKINAEKRAVLAEIRGTAEQY